MTSQRFVPICQMHLPEREELRQELEMTLQKIKDSEQR